MDQTDNNIKIYFKNNMLNNTKKSDTCMILQGIKMAKEKLKTLSLSFHEVFEIFGKPKRS